ncbi:MAG: DUF423 domain-containing protein [Rhodobacteraceae bacterium]|nr:DUF423 domain-containing protein [Paracoccaceae bacterium]
MAMEETGGVSRGYVGAMALLAGALGAAGVALAAVAAHREGGEGLASAATLLSLHAPVPLLAAALAGAGARFWGLTLSVAAIGLGAALFGGQVALGALMDLSLFPMAAPVGGVSMIAGWALLGLCGAVYALGGGRR